LKRVEESGGTHYVPSSEHGKAICCAISSDGKLPSG
jgi:hypothetical protein